MAPRAAGLREHLPGDAARHRVVVVAAADGLDAAVLLGILLGVVELAKPFEPGDGELAALDGDLEISKQEVASRLVRVPANGLGSPPADRPMVEPPILQPLGGADDEDTLREAASRFSAYAENPANVSPDIRGTVFALAAKRGDRSTYDAMWDMRANATLQEEKVRFLYGLTSFEQPELLQDALNRSLGDEIRAHESVSLISLVAGNRSGRDLAWQFLKDNWAELDRRYGEGGFALMRLVSITSGFTTLDMREDVERFFNDNPVPGAERTIRQSLERIQLNNAWLERNREELAAWFVG